MSNFKLVLESSDSLINESAFYKWLTYNAPTLFKTKSVHSYIACVHGYLETLGFVVGIDKLNKDQIQQLRLIYHQWWANEVRPLIDNRYKVH